MTNTMTKIKRWHWLWKNRKAVAQTLRDLGLL